MRTARYVGFLVAALAAVLVASPMAHAAGFSTLHEFAGTPGDGAYPAAGLLQPDPARGFYGTTQNGGAGVPDSGTIFYMQTDGTVTILSTFGDASANPLAPLIRDSHEVYYGTTTLVGGHGSVFFMTDDGADPPALTGGGTLCLFSGTDGDTPRAALLQAAPDTFYGTTELGGANSLGTIFRMDVTRDGSGVPIIGPGGTTCTKIYDFNGATDGALPLAALILASDGNIYGTTYVGGANNLGTIFRVVGPGTTNTFELLHSFAGTPSDGAYPYAALLQSAPGGFYGTTSAGGTNNSGTVFYMKNSAPWNVTTLASFPLNLGTPYAPLMRDTDGVFYGTTALGGSNAGGNIFVMTVDTSDPPILTLGATIHSFPAPNPYGPAAPILKGADGSFYGTTYGGGTSGLGTIFKFTHTAQTIAFAAIPNKTMADSPLTVSATASSGLTVTFSASGPNCHMAPPVQPSPAQVILDAVGTCTVTASQGGDDGYKPAPDVSRTFGIGAGAGVDLIVTAVSDPPLYAAPGSNFSVTDTTQNQGMLPAYGPITGYYLSLGNGPTKLPADILLQNGLRPVSTLNAGASSTGTVAKVYVPNNTLLNTYYLKACADYNNHVAESNENNNCLASGQVEVTKPDLVVTLVQDPPATAARGSRFTFQNTVRNNGNVPAGAFVVSYYLTKGGVNSLLGARSLSSLAATTDSLATASVVVPGTAKGVYNLRVCADTTNSVKETDEGNNCTNSTNTVTVP